jgi:hypothetical protein
VPRAATDCESDPHRGAAHDVGSALHRFHKRQQHDDTLADDAASSNHDAASSDYDVASSSSHHHDNVARIFSSLANPRAAAADARTNRDAADDSLPVDSHQQQQQ